MNTTSEQTLILVNGKLTKTPADVKAGDVVEKLPPHLVWAIKDYTDAQIGLALARHGVRTDDKLNNGGNQHE